MTISQVTTSKTSHENRKKFLNTNDQGFTLIEILIVISLIGLVFGVVVSLTRPEREKLEEVVSAIERAIKYCSNEAILKNKVVRLTLDPTKESIEYKVQVGSHPNLLLPEYSDESSLGLQERERQEKIKNNLDSSFTDAADFIDQIEELNEDIYLAGVASSYSKSVIQNEPASIYFYPSGQRDAAMIVFASYQETATLKLDSFRTRLKIEFEPIQQFDEEEQLLELIKDKAREYAERWFRENS